MKNLDNHWPAMDVQEAFKRLEGFEDGLSDAQGRQQLEENGPNSLEVEEGAGPLFLISICSPAGPMRRRESHCTSRFRLMGALAKGQTMNLSMKTASTGFGIPVFDFIIKILYSITKIARN